jgi:hypothetical protein
MSVVGTRIAESVRDAFIPGLSVYFCLADRFFNSFSCFWLDLFWEC